jgi:hypothetical protein
MFEPVLWWRKITVVSSPMSEPVVPGSVPVPPLELVLVLPLELVLVPPLELVLVPPLEPVPEPPSELAPELPSEVSSLELPSLVHPARASKSGT